ncbi:hypothetical protein [Arthrobacter sp. CJ23]|uniref:hypothetical protein n=1 Tax=Arthrobacter sp. CJ23 TaxID=2972479 RepID=UPI00215CC0CA|nr:hypothetical protein [Arthrobacter sp. CJ23]UVJ38355.1 hypothetical protein NVV90_14030 [Arthrobacter sp. CJ23]
MWGSTVEQARARRRAAPFAGVTFAGTALAVLLASCSVNVPDPQAPTPVQEVSTLATPSITPGHDAAAVAAKDLPFGAGGSLADGVPVGISGGLEKIPGWSLTMEDAQGESRYTKTDGCAVAARLSINQGPLSVPGDDKASTEALFRYLDPAVVPERLTVQTLRWGGDADKPAPRVEVLALEPRAKAPARSTAVLARLFSRAGSSAYISISCPDAGTLAKAKADVGARLAIVPPSN